ncbi:hypothetical protein RV420_460089 [Roseovarius sp. EC-SD190]|nr:hypothetical protein RV420_460089 [Roseovarius sp. EC-SD190]
MPILTLSSLTCASAGAAKRPMAATDVSSLRMSILPNQPSAATPVQRAPKGCVIISILVPDRLPRRIGALVIQVLKFDTTVHFYLISYTICTKMNRLAVWRI